MEARIISLLKNRFPDYVSGEEISRLLGVSRTAIWKHMSKLREKGYQIESHSKIGYRLLHAPDRLYEHEVRALLTTEVVGRTIIHHGTVGSTNEWAKDMAQKGASEGTVVIAEEQTSGKGRLGRAWYSPAGQGLWFSVILRPAISPVDAAKLTLVAAVAVARAVRQLTGVQTGIKWPNDILIAGRKAAGILTEMNAEIDSINYLVIGIGVNFNLNQESVPEELAQIATSVTPPEAAGVSRAELLAGILNNLDCLYAQFLRGNFASILSDWKEMSVTLNRWVRVHSLSTVEEGLAFDVDGEGALLILKKDGSMKRVLSGEVSIREAD